MNKTYQALLQGITLSTIGVVVLFALYVTGPWASPVYASRWRGDCGGWTKALAVWHVVGELLHWYAYVTIGTVIYRLHPVLKSVPSSVLTIYSMVAFIYGCGLGHLIAAYVIFDPVYQVEALWLSINGVISITASVLVAFSLVTAFAYVAEKRAELEKLIEKEV